MQLQVKEKSSIQDFKIAHNSVDRMDRVSLSSSKKDSVNFKGGFFTTVPKQIAEVVAKGLTEGTSGYRKPWKSEEFDEKVVQLITQAAGVHVAGLNGNRKILVGGDTREATKAAMGIVPKQLADNGFRVIVVKEPVPTPVHALLAREKNIDLGFLFTASHNHWGDAGFNFVTKDAAIAPQSVTKFISDNVVKLADNAGHSNAQTGKKGSITEFDPYKLYKNQISKAKPVIDWKAVLAGKFGELNPVRIYQKIKTPSKPLIDWKAIQKGMADKTVFYDSLQGTGQNYLPRLLKENGINVRVFNTKVEGPDPTAENLSKMITRMKKAPDSNKVIGLATDGDADRFAIIDGSGKFIAPNDVIFLHTYNAIKEQGFNKEKLKNSCIVVSHVTSPKAKALAEKYGVEVIETPVGFKYVGEEILELEKHGKKVLLGGEESGGMTLGGHIPEKDGIIVDLKTLEIVAKEQKNVLEVLKDADKALGKEFAGKRLDFKFETFAAKDKFIQDFRDIFKGVKEGSVSHIEDMEVNQPKTLEMAKQMDRFKKGGDGIGIYFKDGSSFTVRSSGTEAKNRFYINIAAENPTSATEKLQKLEKFANSFITPASKE